MYTETTCFKTLTCFFHTLYGRIYLQHEDDEVAEMGGRLATIDMDRKVGVLCPFPSGKLGPHLTQFWLGRGLPADQMAS